MRLVHSYTQLLQEDIQLFIRFVESPATQFRNAEGYGIFGGWP